MALGVLEDPDGEALFVRDIAQMTGIPKPYLSKLIHDLAAKGLVATKRGYRGGVVLARPADQISLKDIAEAVAGRPLCYPCLLGMHNCTGEDRCPLHKFWKEAIDSIHESLRRTTLAEASCFRCMRKPELSPKQRTRSGATIDAQVQCSRCRRRKRCSLAAKGGTCPATNRSR